MPLLLVKTDRRYFLRSGKQASVPQPRPQEHTEATERPPRQRISTANSSLTDWYTADYRNEEEHGRRTIRATSLHSVPQPQQLRRRALSPGPPERQAPTATPLQIELSSGTTSQSASLQRRNSNPELVIASPSSSTSTQYTQIRANPLIFPRRQNRQITVNNLQSISAIPIPLPYQSIRSMNMAQAQPTPVSKSKLSRFTGTDKLPTVQSWTILFEIATKNITTDEDRLTELMSYLDSEGLEWFATEVAPSITTMTWNQCKALMTNRFSNSLISPNIAAQNRKLTRNDTVKSYYDEKIALLRQTGLNEKDMSAELTNGMPLQYKTVLLGALIKNTSEWLTIATQLEANFQQLVRRPEVRRQPGTHNYNMETQPSTSSQHQNRNKEPFRKSYAEKPNKPPFPCRFCKEQNKIEFHWHRDCPLRNKPDLEPDTKPEGRISNAIAKTTSKQYENYSAHTNAKKQFIQLKAKINGQDILAVMDTASNCHIMSSDIAKLLNLKPDRVDSNTISLARGQAKSIGRVEFPITLGWKTHTIEADVLRNFPYDLLLGINLGEHFPIVLHIATREAFLPQPRTCNSIESKPKKAVSEQEKLLSEFKDGFSEYNPKLGQISLEKHRIRLTDDIPVVQRPYRCSAADNTEINGQVKELLEQNMIRESKSQYFNPVTLAHKKDGTRRLCIDYRLLNAKTVTEAHPMPRVQDIIDKLHNAKVFSVLDIRWGYWHVQMHPDDIHKTAFVTNEGHFEWLVLPFGLKNAPFCFQRIIQNVLGELLNNGCFNFFDDIIVYSPDMESHLELLRKVFEKLRQHNVRLRKEKCQFFKPEVEYLGHMISENTVRPSKQHIQAVIKFPQPRTVKQLRRFLGLSGYLRQFIEGYSTKAEPLTSLLRKDAEYKWTEKQETAFQTLKTDITKEPVLQIFDPDLPVELFTDASKVGIGAILMQNKHPVSYYSRRLNVHESNYMSSELECLAVTESVEHYHVYLHGKPFTVISDHSALQWLYKIKRPVGRLYRWSVRLSMYDFKIIHRSGRNQTHVDALSRAPVNLYLSLDQIRKSQTDENMKPDNKQHISDGIIRVKRKGLSRIVVPKQLIPEVLYNCHEKQGHPGSTKCLQSIAKLYFWPNMERDIREHVRTCHPCQMVKLSPHQPYGHLKPLESPSEPLELIAIDTVVMGSSAKATKAKYIQVCIDHHSRYVWAFATAKNTTASTITVLTNIFKTLNDKPKRILTDNGTNYTSKEFKRFLKSHNIVHSLTTPYRPQTNGMNEKVNGTIVDKLRIAIQTNTTKKWSTLLPDVVKQYNSTVHSVTGFPPAYLMFGTTTDPNPVPLNEARALATERTRKFKEIKKTEFDSKHKDILFQIGDLVKKRIPANHPDKVKLSPKFTGPYKVIKRLPNDLTYQIQNLKNDEIIQAHVNQLESYYLRQDSLSTAGE